MTNYVFFADGFEEIEALSVVDILRRAGMAVETVSVHDRATVTGAHGVPVVADRLIADVPTTEGWLILPGGMPGATNLLNCERLAEMLVEHGRKGLNLAAICASPSVVLAPLGLLNGRPATCYPGMEAEGVMWNSQMVTCHDNIITGRGPAAAAHFALAIVRAELGDDVANGVAQGMLLT
ncbi:MAG: DJ-1/PfpI family protein [Muribaculaceae bacterium]|nr:DJ-1/PfpI family protein [Muribaculaceae bacterium]